jgi:ABC-type transporter Mla MlaB component
LGDWEELGSQDLAAEFQSLFHLRAAPFFRNVPTFQYSAKRLIACAALLFQGVPSQRGWTVQDSRIVLNLSEVSMIDSSGIGLLVRLLASTKHRGGNVKLVQPSKFAVQTLRLVGVLNLFEVFDNDDAAVESFA